jgi:hypothetical protein
LKYDNLNPQFHLPLLSDTLYISDAIDGNSLQYDDNGQGYFVFDIGEVEMPEVTDIFKVPGQNVSKEIGLPLPSGMTIPNGTPFPKWEYSGTVTADIDFGSAEIEPKSITFSGGSLTLTNTHRFPAGTLTVKIANLVKGSSTFSIPIDVTSTTSNVILLNGYTMAVGTDKKMTIEYKYQTNGFTAREDIDEIKLGFNINMKNIAIGEARGYFGKHTEYAKQSINIGDFDDLDGEWALKEASIALEIQNSIQLPMRVVIDTIRSYTDIAPGAKPVVEKVRIDSLTLGNTDLKDTLTLPGEIISLLPKKIDVVVKVQSNPDGKNGQDNVISSQSSAAATAKILVPLKIKDVDIMLIDTTDLDVSDMSFKNLGLLLNVSNSLPLGVKLQCILLQKGTGTSLGELFDTPVEIPAGNITPVGNGDSEVTSPSETHKLFEVKKGVEEKLKNADKIVVLFSASTGNTNDTYVRITKSNYVSLKIGLRAGINAGDLKEKL